MCKFRLSIEQYQAEYNDSNSTKLSKSHQRILANRRSRLDTEITDKTDIQDGHVQNKALRQ